MIADIQQPGANSQASRGAWAVIVVLLAVLVAGVASAATPSAAADNGASAAERPIYLDVVPVAGAENKVLPAGVVVAMARQTLSSAHQAVIQLHGQHLPPGVRVLRILYIVHEQSGSDGTTLAASASTALLRTAADSAGGTQTYSLYSGMQQTLVQGPDKSDTISSLRAHFKQELQDRIASAADINAAG